MKRTYLLFFIVLLTSLISESSSRSSKNNNNDNTGYVIAGVVGIGSLALFGAWYAGWFSESDHALFERYKQGFEENKKDFTTAEQFVGLLGSRTDGIFGRYKNQTEDNLFFASDLLQEQGTTGNQYEQKIKTLLKSTRGSFSELKKRSKNVSNEHLLKEYQLLETEYAKAIATLSVAQEYLSEHKSFFDLYFEYHFTQKKLHSLLFQNTDDAIIQEAVIFSSSTTPRLDCVELLDAKIVQLERKKNACEGKYSYQVKNADVLLSQLYHVKKIIKNDPEYTKELHHKEMVALEKERQRIARKKADDERIARERTLREQERQNRKKEVQRQRELRIKEQKINAELRTARAQEEANQLKQQELQKVTQQPVHVHVQLDPTNMHKQDDVYYYDQHGNAYARSYVDEHDIIWTLYMLENGMLYYAAQVNGILYFKDLFGNTIGQPW